MKLSWLKEYGDLGTRVSDSGVAIRDKKPNVLTLF